MNFIGSIISLFRIVVKIIFHIYISQVAPQLIYQDTCNQISSTKAEMFPSWTLTNGVPHTHTRFGINMAHGLNLLSFYYWERAKSNITQRLWSVPFPLQWQHVSMMASQIATNPTVWSAIIGPSCGSRRHHVMYGWIYDVFRASSKYCWGIFI